MPSSMLAPRKQQRSILVILGIAVLVTLELFGPSRLVVDKDSLVASTNPTTVHNNSNSISTDYYSLSSNNNNHNNNNMPTQTTTINNNKRYENQNNNDNDTKLSSLSYPLHGLVNISSAKESYQNGFWQRMEPVPWDRWEVVSNTTCDSRKHNVQDAQTTTITGSTWNNLEWTKRVPRVILIGAQKAGSTALAQYLYNHPNILKLPKKELHFFDETLDQDYSIIAASNTTTTGNDQNGIPAQKALTSYQQDVIGNLVPLKIVQTDTSKNILDATPNYLFPSDRVPQRICCIVPWVKLLCLLRDPVDRAFSQYYMQFNRDLANPSNRRGFVSFEEYIELDLKVLQETGVVQDWSVVDFESFSGSAQEWNAWRTYTKLGLNAPVGRGLYAIQLRHWLEALDACGKSRSDLLIVKSEDMRVATDEVYTKVLEFLNLKPHHMGSYGKVHTTAYRSKTMNPATHEKLKAFYRPYNLQLEKILGGEWAGVWD